MKSEKTVSGSEAVDSYVWDSIDYILEQRKISLRKISDDLSISYRTLQNYRAGRTNVSIPNLKKICEYLQIESDYFLFGGVDLDRLALLVSVEQSMGDLLDRLTFEDRKLVVSDIAEPESYRRTKALVISAAVRDAYILQRQVRRGSPDGGAYHAKAGIEVVLADRWRKVAE